MIVHDVEQRSEEWYRLRAGMPTASAFGNLLTPKTLKPSASIHTYAAMLANEVFTGDAEIDGFEGNQWTDRGAALESEAIRWYEFVTDMTVQPIGFVTDDDKRIGCSPDGLVGESGMLEIKALKAVNHTAAFMEFTRTNEAPPEYRPQTQGQMMICGRSWCDLLFFHDRLPPFVVRQFPDPDYIEKLTPQIDALLTERDEILAALNPQAAE